MGVAAEAGALGVGGVESGVACATGTSVTGAAVPPVPGRAPDLYSAKAPRSTSRPPPRTASATSGACFPPLKADAAARGAGRGMACPHDGHDVALAARLVPHLEHTVVDMELSFVAFGQPEVSGRCARP
jgi:hypothetical protein